MKTAEKSVPHEYICNNRCKGSSTNNTNEWIEYATRTGKNMTQFSICGFSLLLPLRLSLFKYSISTFGNVWTESSAHSEQFFFRSAFDSFLFYSGGCATGELLFSLVFDGSKNQLREWKRKQSTVADQKSKWELRYVFLCNVCAQHDGYSLQLSKAKKKVNQSVMYIDIVYFDAAHECVHVCTYLHNLHVLCRKVLIEWCAN